MSLAVVTISIGDACAAISRQTRPFLEAYAARVGADFITIELSKSLGPTPHFEKYQLRDLLDSYERVLYVDADVLVVPDAPDLFRIVPPDEFGAYLASRHSDVHDGAATAIQEVLGQIGWGREYFNSGVMIASRDHREVFDLRHGSYVSFYEQTQLNYNVRKLGVPIRDITFRFNHVEAAGGERLTSYFIHYAGPGHGAGSKPAQVARDAATLLANRSRTDSGKPPT